MEQLKINLLKRCFEMFFPHPYQVLEAVKTYFFSMSADAESSTPGPERH